MPEGQWPRGVTPIRGQGQRLRVPNCDGTGTAERSYPVSEVRGGGGGGRPKEDTLRLRSGVAARRRYPTPQTRGQGQRAGGATPGAQAQGQGRRVGGATLHPRSCG